MKLINILKTCIFAILGVASLLVVLGGAWGLMGLIVPGSKIGISEALASVLIGSFVFTLCAGGGKIHQPLYVLVPFSLIVAFAIAMIFVAIVFNLHEDTESGPIFILISCVLIVVLPFILFRLIRKYYRKKTHSG